ncbi:c-type cytochrome [Sulfitobacter sabulilitoris]|uniref:C-type cytochrome n=1 Tax=Sulfitobacter sabulilitoris TaxID=2562655 RepID=A0A5S3PCB2_9RHOB|nr:c-type cytochrome [Sulfitobacter sabulilitoris]
MTKLLTVIVFAASGAGPAMAQDGDDGKEIYQSVCKNCHGPTGKGMASFPKLVGKGEEYLTQRLEAYRAGEKIGPNSALMMPLAEDLSDEDIASIVTYITTELE